MGVAVRRQDGDRTLAVRDGKRSARRDPAQLRQEEHGDAGSSATDGATPDEAGETLNLIQWEASFDRRLAEPEFARLWQEGELPWNTHMALINARHDAGLTQAEVAARMGTTQSVVARMENGWHLPSLRTIERYAAAVGATVEVRLVAVAAAPTILGR